jgi:hypothetical protein
LARVLLVRCPVDAVRRDTSEDIGGRLLFDFAEAAVVGFPEGLNELVEGGESPQAPTFHSFHHVIVLFEGFCQDLPAPAAWCKQARSPCRGITPHS